MAITTQHADYVERHEKTLIFNAINETDFCINVLFCFHCEEWLMAPIYTQDIGVHICARCYYEDEVNASTYQNEKLDSLLTMYVFPCKHYAKGCAIKTTFRGIRQHEEKCNVITNEWKDLHCCACEFQTLQRTDLLKHYTDVHNVPTIVESAVLVTRRDFEETTGMLFVKRLPNLFAIKLNKNSNAQICDALDVMPQFLLRMICEHRNYMFAINTNMNQLKWQGNEITICRDCQFVIVPAEAKEQCKNQRLGCLSEKHGDGIVCSYGLVRCCDQSFSANEHCKHIKLVHAPLNCALVKRNGLDLTKQQYINVDDNIFRLMKQSIAKLYWFAGNWKYSVFVLLGGEVQATEILELSEIHQLPNDWDALYISRTLVQ